MLSINDHLAIRECFAGLTFHETDIKYSVSNTYGASKNSGELIITNFTSRRDGWIALRNVELACSLWNSSAVPFISPNGARFCAALQ